MKPAKGTPRALHPRQRVYCKSCGHVARRYFDKIDEPCTECCSKRVEVRATKPEGERWRVVCPSCKDVTHRLASQLKHTCRNCGHRPA